MSKPGGGLLGELRNAIEEMRIHVALLEEADKEIEAMEAKRDLPKNLERERRFYERRGDEHLRLIRREVRKSHAKAFVKMRAPKIARAAAIVVALIAIGMTTAVATIPNVRIMVLELLVRMEPEYTELGLQKIDLVPMDVPEEWKGKYYPEYIPEGYNIIEVSDSFNFSSISYSNIQGRSIFFGEYQESYQINFDTENAQIEDRRIRGMQAVLSEKDGTIYLTWSDDENYFLLEYEGEKEEAIRIAESVEGINQN